MPLRTLRPSSLNESSESRGGFGNACDEMGGKKETLGQAVLHPGRKCFFQEVTRAGRV